MKVVLEKVLIFICVIKNEIPLFREFSFSGTSNEPLSECLCGIHFLLSGPISEEALITRYRGTIETCEKFQVNLSIRSSLSVDCGNLTLDHQLV